MESEVEGTMVVELLGSYVVDLDRRFVDPEVTCLARHCRLQQQRAAFSPTAMVWLYSDQNR